MAKFGELRAVAHELDKQSDAPDDFRSAERELLDAPSLRARNEFFAKFHVLPRMDFENPSSTADAYLDQLMKSIDAVLSKADERAWEAPSYIDERAGNAHEQEAAIEETLQEAARVAFMHQAIRDSLHAFTKDTARERGKIPAHTKRSAEYLLSILVYHYSALAQRIRERAEVMNGDVLGKLQLLEHTSIEAFLFRQGDALSQQSLYSESDSHMTEVLWTNAFYVLRDEFEQLDLHGIVGKKAEIALMGLLRHAPGILQALLRRAQNVTPLDSTLKPRMSVEAAMPYEDVLQGAKAPYAEKDLVIGTAKAFEDVPSAYTGVQVKFLTEQTMKSSADAPLLHIGIEEYALWKELCELFDRYVAPPQGASQNTTPVTVGFDEYVRVLNVRYNGCISRLSSDTSGGVSALGNQAARFHANATSYLRTLQVEHGEPLTTKDIDLLKTVTASARFFNDVVRALLEDPRQMVPNDIGHADWLLNIPARDPRAYADSGAPALLQRSVAANAAHPFWRTVLECIPDEYRQKRGRTKAAIDGNYRRNAAAFAENKKNG